MNDLLTQPIEAHLDQSLHIVEADPPIRRLHLRARGSAEAPLAIPQLAALCRNAQRFGTAIARSIRIADDEHDIYLWAEAKPDAGGVHLIIKSWRQEAAERAAGALSRSKVLADRNADKTDSGYRVQLDSALKVIACDIPVGTFGDEDPTGKLLTDLVRIEDEPPSGGHGFIEAIAERQPFSDQAITVRGSNRRLSLSGRPLFDGANSFAGYLCDISLDDLAPTALSASPRQPLLTDGAFGPEFMSALRQPVGRILANAETISNRMQGALRSSYANYAGDIVEAAKHLRALIDDMSDLEAIERPEFSPQPDAIDLADLGRRTAGLLAVKASDHQIRIIAPAQDEKVPATGEFRRVLQILVNLVTNAIRYSSDGSTVSIDAVSFGDRAQIRVSDEGSGIPEEDHERIFEKFERLGRQGDGGSGLGLYISRRIANALGGTLRVESSGDNGTTFLLDLPGRSKD